MERLVILTPYYIPSIRYGGPTTSHKNVIETCSDAFAFYVFCNNHDFGSKDLFYTSNSWECVDKAEVFYEERHNYLSRRAYKELTKQFNKIKPSMIWIDGLLSFEVLWPVIHIGKKMNLPILVSPRGEVCKATMGMKSGKKKLYAFVTKSLHMLDGLFFHATSDEEVWGLQEYFDIRMDKIFLCENIPTPPERLSQTSFKQREKDVLNLVFISRIQEKKNLLFALTALKECPCRVVYDIYGPIESEDYWSECTSIMSSLPENICVNYKGILKPDEVGPMFRNYDAFLFPTISENYGHVIAESLANGCPVILTDGATPWSTYDFNSIYICKDTYEDYRNIIMDLSKKKFDGLIDHVSVNEEFCCFADNSEAVALHKKMFNTVIGK